VSHEKTGLVFPSEDEPAYVAAMERIVEDSMLRFRCSAEAIGQFDARFTAEVMQERFLGIYEQLVGGK
jgi:glycosyltransferase involved in cell wall biosynthesis